MQTLRAVPGVIDPVTGPLQVLWRSEMSMVPWTDGWRDSRTSVGARVRADRSIDVVSIDARTGLEQWSVPLLPAPTRALSSFSYAGSGCAATAPTSTGAQSRVVCLAADGHESVGADGQVQQVRSTTSRMKVIDTSSGTVLAEHDTETRPGVLAQHFALLGAVAVVSGTNDAGSVDIWALDLRTGAELWRRDAPVPDAWAQTAATHDLPVSLRRLNDEEVLASVPGRLEVIDAAGRSDVVDDGDLSFSFHPTATETLLTLQRAGSTVVRSMRGQVTVDGDLVPTAIDDASMGSVLFSRSGGDLVAVDVHTGDVRWRTDEPYPTVVAVLEGRVLVETSSGWRALDGEDGAELWERPRTTGPAMHQIISDGNLWYVNDLPKRDGRAQAELVGLSVNDGAERLRLPLPDGVTDVESSSIGLASWSDKGFVILG